MLLTNLVKHIYIKLLKKLFNSSEFIGSTSYILGEYSLISNLYGFKGFKGISYFINEGNLEFDLVS
jgi:hypothetical protein